MEERGSHEEMESKKSGTDRRGTVCLLKAGSDNFKVSESGVFYPNLPVNETPLQLYNMLNCLTFCYRNTN